MMRRISDPPIYEHLKQLQPLESDLDGRRDRSGLHDISLHLECHHQPAQRAQRPRRIPGIPIPWNGRFLRLPDTETFPVTPTVYHGPYEYSVPGLSKDYLPQTEKAPDHVKLEAH